MRRVSVDRMRRYSRRARFPYRLRTVTPRYVEFEVSTDLLADPEALPHVLDEQGRRLGRGPRGAVEVTVHPVSAEQFVTNSDRRTVSMVIR